MVRPFPGCMGCTSGRAIGAAGLLLIFAGFVSAQEPNGQVYGFVSFSTQRVEVEEDSGNAVTTVQLPLIREVGTTGTILATVEVTNSSVESDFFSFTDVASFTDGDTTATAILLLRNDAIPEGNETFIVEITGTRFGADIGSVNSLALFVRANDEPHGDFRFSTGSQSVTASEGTADNLVQLTIERSPGSFGRVTIDYQITSGPNNGIDDLSPAQGRLVFNDRVGNMTLDISVTADDIPETEELFTVRLSNPRGGAGLAVNGTEAVITVEGNDTPLRFSESQYTVEEDAGSAVLTITRGTLADGTKIGNLMQESSVDYETLSGTAVAGVDFEAQSGTIVFASGVASQNISIPITDDTAPEGDELFTVSLSSPSSDAVLSTPALATVLVAVNDNAGGLVQFSSAGPVIVNEDDGSIAEFTVRRLNGTFGNVTIEWQIVDSSETLAADDFQITRGNITILHGENEVVLQIQPINDDSDEIAERFSVELIGIVSRTGELHPMGTRVSSLIVEDSDDVYGLVELAADSLLTVTSNDPRELHLAVARSPGTTGTISVDYYVAYLTESVSDPLLGDSSVFAADSGSVRLLGGQMTVEWDVEILSEAFLDTSAQFYVKLNGTYLVEGVVPLVTPTNSPRIGPRSEAYISVPEAASNGYISFSQSSVLANEPDSGFGESVSLDLTRSGAYGTATVAWRVVSITTDSDDLGTSSGITVIENGSTTSSTLTQIVVVIINDDEPEVAETFEVQLVSVSESGQRVDTEHNTSVVTIALNDNADGIFTVSSSQTAYTIAESSDTVITIRILRDVGALTTQSIQYQTLPGTGSDFIGGFGVEMFGPGRTEATVLVLPNDDDIPEDSEEFNFTISASNGDILGNVTYIGITILANDEYAGVFSFTDSSLDISIDEPGLEDASSTATLTIQRDRGMFTEVIVFWEITESSASGDVNPDSGNVTFGEGQTTGTLDIYALEDEVPEDDIRYTVALTNVSGDGELSSSSTQARLTVRHNDDSINLRDTALEAFEGETLGIVVTRGGHASGVAEVSFQVDYVSASTEDVVIMPSSGTVRLENGENETRISLVVVNDVTPEETERLEVRLTSTTGDAVLVTPTTALISILPSDDPNGVFEFTADSRNLSVEEGDTLQLSVERLQGSFGTVEVRVSSYLLNISTGEQTSTSTATDLSPTTWLLTFPENETLASFDLDITDEELPEFEERFELVLTIDSSTGDSDNGARLGSYASSLVTVAESDDPNGLFAISTLTSDVQVAEDVGEDGDGGSVEVIVERMFGDSGTVQVNWELVPELDPPLPAFTDLLFLGARASGVSDFQSRNNTGTVALEFTGDAVTVARRDNPPIITNKLTISLWLLMTGDSSGGVLMAKTTDSGANTVYGLEITPNGGDFIIRFSYLPASRLSGSESVEVSIVQSSLADGSWHSLTAVINGSIATFYLDASPINSRTLEEPSIGDRDGGDLSVGGVVGATNSFFTGALQDVRVYAASLDESQISAIATDDTALSLTPISGYLSYGDGDREEGIVIRTIDDLLPEPSALFQLQLTNSNGGSRIDSTANFAEVTVLKSDAANGVFGFDSSSLSNSVGETGSVSLTVQRLQGDHGSVTVHWEIRDLSTGTVATSDFETASGMLEFLDGDREETLVLRPTDEIEPELDEEFAVFLTDAVSNDGFTSSTPTSGASIDSSLERSNLTVTENDYPYGLLQFSTTLPPASGLIPAAGAMPEVSVMESAGTVTVYIVRAQGTLGTISVEYLTRDGTATGSGVSPDYVSTAGSVEFSPSDRQVSVELELVDDEVPEREKLFYVSLTNPAGDEGVPGLSIGSNITIRILPSDDAFGVFSFATDSLSRLVSESGAGTSVTLNIDRVGGTVDDVSVYWEVEGENEGDITPTSGRVDFAEGVTEGELTITITNDQSPELEEEFSLRLLNASGGATITTSGSQVATVTVRASDHPYGLFTFSSAFRPLVVSEGVGEAEVMVTREFGDLGRVTVGYTTVESEHSSLEGLVDVAQLQEDSQLAVAGEDYTLTSGELIFADGELMKSFIVPISDDTGPEVAEYIFVTITSVQLDPSSVEDVDNSVLPTSGSGNGSLAFVVIDENDDARGVLQLSRSTYDAEEPSQNFVTVNRTAGTFGMVSVDWEATAITAQSSDFIPRSGTVQLAEGVSSARLPLSVINDADPEFAETLRVNLVGSGGDARLGGVLVATVTILANDDPNGALEFAETSRTVSVLEPEDGSPAIVMLTVERTGGVTGVVGVSWSLSSSNGEDSSLDIVPVSGTLQYITSDRQEDITLTINADDIPEVAETFTISLSEVTGGARIGDASSATVTIEANDSPNGFVSLESPTVVVTEDSANTTVMIPVVRSAGLFRNISVFYSTAASSPPSATAGNDYAPIVGEEIIIAEGSSFARIPVTILADNLPELNETFQISLISVSFSEELPEDSGSGGPQLGSTTSTKILIRENDDPYGRFRITGSGGESVVRIQEVGNLGVSLTVSREAGRVGTVEVSWSVTGGTAVENVDFGGSGAVLTFDEDTSRTVSLIIFQDDLPERDEDIIISLSNPTGGAVLMREGGDMVTVVIEANDNAAGIVGLVDTARSAIVDEGETVRLALERTVGALGVVDVVWEISGPGDVSLEFLPTTGNATFEDGESMTEIVFAVAADGTPELAEEYYLSLTAVHTVSSDISPSGSAEIDPDASMATITLRASDNPHGVVEFQEISVLVESEESSPAVLTVIREFGSIGALEVVYEAVMGNLSSLEANTTLATRGFDFNSTSRTLRLEDGQTSINITAPIIDDSEAERAEVFLVRLNSVNLDSSESESIPPSIGVDSQSQVTVLPNDNPQGILTFLQSSVNVSEEVGEVVLTVRRDQGTVGRVSAVALVTEQGATADEDYIVTNYERVVFTSGEVEETIVVTIVDDPEPELDEVFCVSLILPEGEVDIGGIAEVCVTILLNDDAFGQFSFDSSSLTVTISEAGEMVTAANVAELRVIRSGGVNGEVSIPFELEQNGRNDLLLLPSSGYLLFEEEQDFGIIEVTAVRDDIPELEETYTVTLLDPDTIGDLSEVDHTANITIRANQNPHGLLEIFQIDSDANELSVEEDVRYVELEIRRSFGTFGEIEVSLGTIEGSAIAPTGDSLSFSVTQFIETTSAEKWYHFSRDSTQYLFLASSSATGDSVLFEWRGAFVPVQRLATFGATASAFLSVEGRDLLVVANSGTSGSRETNSTVYEFTESGLTEVQTIATVGASDVASFGAPNGEWYIVIASREDDGGSPNVDSVVMRWSQGRFVLSQSLETIGASAVEILSIEGSHYLVFASFTDTRSPVYVWREGQFRLDHHLDTLQASDVESKSVGGTTWLVFSEGFLGVSLLQWSTDNGVFVFHSTLNSTSALRVESVPQTEFLLVTNSEDPGQLFDVMEQQNVGLPVSRHLYPFSLDSITVQIASAIGTEEQSSIGQLQEIGSTTDFYSRSTALKFAAGQTYHRLVVEIINDATPELDEQFSVQLSWPTGGAVLGSQSSLTINILTNDDAYGLVGFSEDSLSVVVPETESSSEVALTVVRERGTFGEVRVSWQVMGDHSTGEITPSSGEVLFAVNVSEATITLTVHPDLFPELNEVTVIELTEITANGVPPGSDASRGAQLLPERTRSFITVQANDAPHGVLVWSASRVLATEEDSVDNSIQLTILREFGSIGAILISYSTSVDTSVPIEDRATPGLDYLPTTSSVTMGNNSTSTSIPITILHDNEPELLEPFTVSLTNVTLVNEGDRQGSMSNSPRIDLNRGTVIIDITENDNSRGLIEFVASEVTVDEDVGTIELEILRNSGTFGRVSVDFNVTGITATGEDFSSDSGTVVFEMDSASQNITIFIINDLEAELEETFVVYLVNPQDGADIGDLNSVTVTINSNDDVHGAFSFDNVLILLPESEGPEDENGVASLTVLRATSTVGEVTVYWEVSEDGVMDLQPSSGSLTFNDTVSEQSFEIRAVADGTPELFESFVVSLVSTEGGGRIVEPSEARIAIQASDDPNGVIGFDSYPNGIIINEGDLLTFRILRFAGLNGEVTATWQIIPSDTAVFTTTSTIEIFSDGQSEVIITVQTISDDIPETARLFSLEIVSTGLATVNESLSQVDIIVTASDDPHGVVEFEQPSARTIQESGVTISVPVERHYGLVGNLRANFTILSSSTATSAEDYTLHNQSILIPSNSGSADIYVTINDDMVPELSETLSLSLVSVQLTQDIDGGRDFEFSGYPTAIDQYPRLGTVTRYTVTISENDNPYGTVSLGISTLIVTEGSLAVVSVGRTGGTFGLVIVTVTVTSGGAGTSDYLDITGTRLQLFEDETSVNITIPITQDDDPELQEDFSVSISLSSSSSPAVLGAITSTTIIIDSSDSPHGEVGFRDPLVYNEANPTSIPNSLDLRVDRTRGNIGQTQVVWEVVGPYPGQESTDISPTGDTLELQNGQSGGTITLNILPSQGDEEEKTFIISLLSASNDVEIDPTRDTVIITVAQRGMPYGTVGFFGDVIELHKVDEGVGPQSTVFPIARTAPALGDVMVSFTVTGDTDPSFDVHPTSGAILLPSGLSQVDLILDILDDVDPELEETFTVILSQPTGGAATLDQEADRSTFTIRANDAPYGRFRIEDPSIVVDQTVFSEISRIFTYTIAREYGRIGDVFVNVVTTYNPEPIIEYVEEFSTVIVDGRIEQQVQLPLSPSVYIAPASTFNVSVTQVSLQNLEAQEGSGPEIGSPAELVATEDVANALIGFDSNSLAATVTDDTTESYNVALTVVRTGVLGTVMVYWRTGLPDSTVANGSITPEQGSFQMNPSDATAQILLTVTPVSTHGVQEVFAVSLSVEPIVPLNFPAQVDPATQTAHIEPSGVVQLASDAFSGVESTGNIQVTVERYYGSVGDIQVFGVASVVANTSVPLDQEAAVQSVDFAATVVQVTLPDGSTSGTLSVPILDNQESEPLKVFQFTLTSVAGGVVATSPRLSTSGTLTALLTIIDDEAGAGIFRLAPTEDSVLEESGRVSFSVTREGGSRGRVAVMLEIVEGNSADSSAVLATDGVDYIHIGLVPQEVVFEDGDSAIKTFSITLIDDTEPELDEQFTVVLSNLPAGTALIDPDASATVVTITASDSPGGVFSLSPTSITLSEESAPTGTITVERSGGVLTEVRIEWEALYTDGQIHNTAINSILGVDRATVIFPVGVTSVDISLTLQPNSVPATGEVFTLRIQSDDSGVEFASPTEATVTVQAKQSSLFQITATDLKKVVTQPGAVTVGVERVNGTQLSATVHYSTVELPDNITIGQLTLQPAKFGVHYTGSAGSLTFTTSDTEENIVLNIIDSELAYPRAFNVTISTSAPHAVRNWQAVVVLVAPGPLSRLIDIYFDTLEATAIKQIESVTNSLYKLLSEGTLVEGVAQFVNGEEQLQFKVLQYIISEVTSRASSRYTDSLTGNMSDIFQLVLGDASFSRRSELIRTMQTFAYSLLDGEQCDANLPVKKSSSRLLFHLEAERLPPSLLAQRRYTASFNSDDDYVKFPVDSIFPGSSLVGVECVDVHYIELVEDRILKEPTLSSKVLSIGIRGQSTQTQSPVTYRIYTDTKVMPSEKDCLLWNSTQKGWDNSICKAITSGILPQRNDYVECECFRLGEFAVSNDVERGFGWTLSAGLVAAFVVVVMILVIGVHLCYFQRTQLVTRIFVMLCVSVFLYQLMLLVSVFASDQPDTTESGCAAIAIMLHFTVILQYVWILALAVSLWTNFMGITDGKEPLVIYTIICWVVAILWVISTLLIGRFGLDGLGFSDVYGLAGDFCYTPELSVSLVSTLLPVVMVMLAAVAFFSHSCIYWSRWEDFHNMYLDSFNRTEIPLLLMFFAVVFLSSVSAYVHLYARQVYTYGIFVTLEFLQGLYTLIVYVFLSWHTLTRKHKKYGIDDEVEPLTVPGEPDYMGSLSSLASSTRRINIKEEEECYNQGTKSREQEPSSDSDEDSSGSSLEGAPVIPLALRQFPSVEPSIEGDDSQLDDLMFMLKTQNLPPDDDTSPLFPESPHKPTASEHLELRRISIADTHL